jgi:hypothetical protein
MRSTIKAMMPPITTNAHSHPGIGTTASVGTIAGTQDQSLDRMSIGSFYLPGTLVVDQ